MIEVLYNTFGFFVSFILLMGGFGAFIFWIAGIAGISQLSESEDRSLKLVLAILFPPYPFCWLIYDIYRQSELMKEDL